MLTSPGARMMLIRAGSADEAWGQADGATDGMMYPPQPIDGHFNSGVPVAPFYEQVRASAALWYACMWLWMCLNFCFASSLVGVHRQRMHGRIISSKNELNVSEGCLARCCCSCVWMSGVVQCSGEGCPLFGGQCPVWDCRTSSDNNAQLRPY